MRLIDARARLARRGFESISIEMLYEELGGQLPDLADKLFTPARGRTD